MSQTQVQAPFVANNANFRNKIVNGDLSVDQRNGTATINGTGVTYNVDRFLGRGVASAGVFTLAQDTTSPDNFTSSIKATVTTADSSIATGSSYRLQTNIEGINMADMNWGSSSARTAVLSFYVRSSVTGTFGLSVANGDFNRFRVFSYTIDSADTWERKIITVPGDTSGTWPTDNTLSVRLNWSLGIGTNVDGTVGSYGSSTAEGLQGQTNLIATNNATFYLTGVQFEVDSGGATDFEFLPHDIQLQRCMRYYQKIADHSEVASTSIGDGYYYSSSVIMSTLRWPVPMRAAPTADQVTGTNYYALQRAGDTDNFDGVSLASFDTRQCRIYVDSGASGTTGQAGRLLANNASAYLALTAEL